MMNTKKIKAIRDQANHGSDFFYFLLFPSVYKGRDRGSGRLDRYVIHPITIKEKNV